jgi:hypothetical protein
MDATASNTTSGPNDADLSDGGGSELLSHLRFLITSVIDDYLSLIIRKYDDTCLR